MKVSELGEFGLIDRLAEALAARPMTESARRLAVGIGDDAAVWRTGDHVVVATTDTLVEGVHFLPDVAPRDVGWKALAVNVSDIAAMGGRPTFALVTLALPPSSGVSDLEELYEGLGQCAEAYGVTVAGGDIVSAPQLSITVALLGDAVMDSGDPLLLRRDAAREGDAIAVTGKLGGSAGGLRALKAGAPAEHPLARAHLHPQPPLEAAFAAVASGVRCAIDVSDGLLQDIGHICKMSGVSAVVRADDLPVDRALLAAYPDDALQLAAAGGEDYELVLVGERERIDRLAKSVDVPVTVIGEMVGRGEPSVSLVDERGEPISLPDTGWDHLRG